MTHETILLTMIGVAVVLVGLGVWAWLRRTRRDSALAAPVGAVPADAEVRGRFSGFYVATTVHDEPLERLAVRGLGFRARAQVTVTDRGVGIDLAGEQPLFLGPESLVDVSQSTVAIDRVVERDGLLRIVWRAAERSADSTDARTGGTTVDSFLRLQDASPRAAAALIAGILPASSSSSPLPTPTGTDA